jgi:probable HAF family extracellular repeat protein
MPRILTSAPGPASNTGGASRLVRRSILRALPDRLLLSVALSLTGLTACDDPTRPAGPSAGPSADAAAVISQRFIVRSLGTLGGIASWATDVNKHADVVGVACCPGSLRRSFLWRRGHGMTDLGSLGGDFTTATGINDRREVVGWGETVLGSFSFQAWLWSRAGGMVDLGTLGGLQASAYAINNRGEVVGSSESSEGELPAFLWRPGRGMQSLGTLGGAIPVAEAFDINDDSQVVGYSFTAEDNVHAFLWTPAGGMEDLGTLGGAFSVASGISETGEVVGTTEAFAVNMDRTVVGWSSVDATGVPRPFFWTPDEGMQALPVLGGTFGAAYSVNEFGHIVGELLTPGSHEATLWTPTPGPLRALQATERIAAPREMRRSLAPGNGRAAWCAARRQQLGGRLHTPIVVSRVCQDQ